MSGESDNMTTMVEAIETLGKRWKAMSVIGFLVIGSAFWIADQTSGLAASGKKNSSQDEMIQSNNILIKQMAIRIVNIDNNLAMILKLWGIDSSRVNRWRRIPAEPPVDTTTGFPAIGSEWLRKSLDSQRGWLYRAAEDSAGLYIIETVKLWDLTK